MVTTHISPPHVDEVTTKSLLRRPTLVRKFAETNLGADENSQLHTAPIKRAKVAFNNEVEINLVEEWGKPPELIRAEVRLALDGHRNGDDSSYDKVKQIFALNPRSEIPTTTGTLRQYTSALLSNVSLIDESCEDLVQLVYKVDWFARDDSYVALYQRLIGNLVLIRGVWLGRVLEILVNSFLQPTRDIVKLDDVSPRQVRDRIHGALHYLLKLVPAASQRLAHTLSSRYPNILESKRTHVRYVHSLLHIIDYAPELRSEICSLIMNRIVGIDVQVQDDIEDLAEDIGENLVQAIPQTTEEFVDNPDSDDSEESDSESDGESDDEFKTAKAEAKRVKAIANNVEKLDYLLDMVFSYCTTLFANPSTQEIALDILLSQFGLTILPTCQSRHTQFLLFHFVQASPELIDIFIGVLVRDAADQKKTPLIRQTAASYLASFVARGNHVPISVVRDVFDYLSDQLSQLRAQHLPNYRGPDPRRYSTYYALSQALMYIFCFRWRDLTIQTDDDITPSPSSLLYSGTQDDSLLDGAPSFLPNVKETLFLHCFNGLNPLKVCSPAIVTEFARITHHLGLLYIYPYLEDNKRVHIIQHASRDSRETALSALTGEASQAQAHGLDAYFPFDPYKLPRSKKWLEGDYREWQPLPGFDDGEQDEADSEIEENEDDQSSNEGTATDQDEE